MTKQEFTCPFTQKPCSTTLQEAQDNMTKQEFTCPFTQKPCSDEKCQPNLFCVAYQTTASTRNPTIEQRGEMAKRWFPDGSKTE